MQHDFVKAALFHYDEESRAFVQPEKRLVELAKPEARVVVGACANPLSADLVRQLLGTDPGPAECTRPGQFTALPFPSLALGAGIGTAGTLSVTSQSRVRIVGFALAGAIADLVSITSMTNGDKHLFANNTGSMPGDLASATNNQLGYPIDGCIFWPGTAFTVGVVNESVGAVTVRASLLVVRIAE